MNGVSLEDSPFNQLHDLLVSSPEGEMMPRFFERGRFISWGYGYFNEIIV